MILISACLDFGTLSYIQTKPNLILLAAYVDLKLNKVQHLYTIIFILPFFKWNIYRIPTDKK